MNFATAVRLSEKALPASPVASVSRSRCSGPTNALPLAVRSVGLAKPAVDGVL